MMKLTALAVLVLTVFFSASNLNAQSKKEKKSRYYQHSEPEQEFNVKGFERPREKNEVDKPVVEDEYDVQVTRNETDGKYRGEKRVLRKEDEGKIEVEAFSPEKPERKPKEKPGYHTSYGGFRTYRSEREKYDKYYGEEPRPAVQAPVAVEPEPVMAEPDPVPAQPKAKRTKKVRAPREIEIKMTPNENEYRTTVVKRRYTNLDVLSDDLDLAKIQRPVFKGICQECANDVDLIITNKNLSSLEKNYQLKTCYMMRDKRLREILDDDQYKKFLRIKDADEYLVITRDPELKDGVHH